MKEALSFTVVVLRVVDKATPRIRCIRHCLQLV